MLKSKHPTKAQYSGIYVTQNAYGSANPIMQHCIIVPEIHTVYPEHELKYMIS